MHYIVDVGSTESKRQRGRLQDEKGGFSRYSERLHFREFSLRFRGPVWYGKLWFNGYCWPMAGPRLNT